ncbi:MAG: transcriptional repressor [Anaerolineales bacterium]|nr:transcriptional repressor [Anaerolineales bacterium]
MMVEKWLEQLRKNGYRLTEARQAVIQVIVKSNYALTPFQVYEAARAQYPALGLVSVYRTLEKLEELKLIRRVHQDCGCNAYLPQAEGHQHLIICQKCGLACYFEGDDLEDLFTKVGADHGYEVTGHWLQLFGTCAECEQK